MRRRGTAVIFRDGRVLLVKDKGAHRYSLPGGEIHHNEPSVSGAAREVWEELGLHVNVVKRLRDCDFKGSLSEHRVYLIEVSGEPYLRGQELESYIWWDMTSPLPIFDHVKYILNKIRE